MATSTSLKPSGHRAAVNTQHKDTNLTMKRKLELALLTIALALLAINATCALWLGMTRCTDNKPGFKSNGDIIWWIEARPLELSPVKKH